MNEKKQKSLSNKTNDNRKTDVSPKVILGGGRNLGYLSDSLFDEDLKR